jgi:glycosyltransferase involved in cell wall biosynthesis
VCVVKVALLSDCYLPRLGGIEVQVHDLAARLRERGHEVSVFTATPGPQGQRAGVVDRVDGVPVHRLALRLPFELPVNPLAPPELRRRLLHGGYDVAHVHMGVVSPFAVDAARVTTAMGLPTTMTWHCMLGAMEPALRMSGYVGRWAARGVAMNAVSRVAAAPLQRIVGPDHRVRVLPNGIDVARWAAPAGAPARRADHGTQGVRMVSAMRLAGRKRPLQLLQMVRRVRELVGAAVPLQLDVLGEGPQRGRLERYVARNGLGAVVSLPGRVARGELPGRYAAADIYIAPGRLESFGIAALEARTAGLPVVGRAGSGIEEFVQDGVNGYLSRDDEAMARAVARLVSDADLRAGMTAHNRQQPPEQSWEHVVAGAEYEYGRALSLAGLP